MAEFRLGSGDGDPWGQTMQWWFCVADELYHVHGTVPADWQFRASPLGPANEPDEYPDCIVALAGPEDLIRFGTVLARYERWLRRAGHAY